MSTAATAFDRLTPEQKQQLHIRHVQAKTFAGLDLGQKQDYSALAIIERHEITYAERDRFSFEHLSTTEYTLTHIERLPLGTSYPDIVKHVRWTLHDACAGHILSPALIVDATGVGAPVVDLIRQERMPCRLTPVTITSGHSETHGKDGTIGVPKTNLITGLQTAFENHELTISGGIGPQIEILISELMGMRCQVTTHGNERYGAWREGAHDDLALATTLAWWGARRGRNEPEVFGRRRLL